MAMKPLSKAIGLAALTMSGAVLADAPTLKDVLGASGITATGYVDAAYTYYDVDQQLQRDVYRTSGEPNFNTLNYIDSDSNTFTLKQASVTIASQPKVGFGAVATVIAGHDAKVLNSNGNEFDLTQGFVQYATGPDNVLGSGLTLVGGKFFTLMGAEGFSPSANTNISRSISFLYAIPFTDTGVRLAYAPIDNLTLYAGALNSAYGSSQDDNSQKSLQLGFAWAPTPMVSWALTVDGGKDKVIDGYNGVNVGKSTDVLVLDTVVTIKPMDSLSFVLNYDMGSQDDAVLNSSGKLDKAEWESVVGYINYQFTEEWRVSLRGEQFNDKDGYKIGLVELDKTGFPTAKKTDAYTLTVGFAPKNTNFELRGEIRQDNTDGNAIIDKNGNDVTDKQLFAAVEGLYKF